MCTKGLHDWTVGLVERFGSTGNETCIKLVVGSTLMLQANLEDVLVRYKVLESVLGSSVVMDHINS